MARRTGELIAFEPPREVEAQPPAAPGPEVATLRDYINIVVKRRWVILTFFAIVVSAASLWVWSEKNLYRAFCSIEINSSAPRYLGTGVQEVAETGTTMYWQTKEFMETQFQIIKSRVVAQRVVEKLGLGSDADFLGVSQIKDPQKQREAMQRSDAVARLQSRVIVEPVKDSRIVRLVIEDTNPERAMRISNALADAYIDQNLARKLDTTKAAGIWLADQLDSLKGKLESSELTLHEFKKERGILTSSYEDRQSISSQRQTTLNDALTKITMRRAELDAKKRTTDEARRRFTKGEPDALEAIPGVAQNETIGALKIQLIALLQERAIIESRYLEKHPKRAEIDGRIGELKTAIDREVSKIVRQAENELRETVETESQLRDLIEGAKREAFETNKHQVDYNRLKREQENNQRLYDLVLGRLKEADLSGRLSTNNVQVLDRARVPRAPVKPNRPLVVLAAVLFGFLGGLGLAVLFEHLDNTIKGHEDVENYMRAPFLGIVPQIREQGQDQLSAAERGRNRDLYSHRRPKSSVAECIRSIRTNLLFMMPDKQLRRMLITSSGPQEGKTTVATNIAIAMAQSGSRTLLVDTDMRRPRIHRAFGLSNDAGISSLMLQAARLEDVVKETVVPNLWVLPCGPIPPNPAELIHTDRFKNLLVELDGKFDRVIFDSPPLAAVTDALILSGEVDGVVLVVKADRTVRDVAVRSKQALDDVKARLFGVVVNDLDLDKRGYGYYYYYQRYGYYYGEKPSEA